MSIGFVSQPPFRVLKNDIHDKSRDMQEMIKKIYNFENVLNEVMNENTIQKLGQTEENMKPLFSSATVKAIKEMANQDSSRNTNEEDEYER